ncbi:VOC family protein [Sediminibacillus massiliensis]|uniref:VOC family protein n=1 Tax=Sediminibacillus massiliensis TaxID=1926277 RepID=UPI0015C362AE|nr:VOC family protein [Sediminibacillus massiliensis]
MNQDKLECFRIDHIELIVRDLERSLDFYLQILGFALMEKSDGKAILGAGGRKLVELTEYRSAPQPTRGMTGIYHFAILVPGREHLSAFLEHMLQVKYPLTGASDHLFSEAVYLQDPDGIGIEVYADRSSKSWYDSQGNIKVATNPLDVEDLLTHGDHAWSGFPEGTIIGHLHFHVSDIPAARHFYVEKLGLDSTIEFGEQVLFVSGEGYHHHIGLNTWQGTGAKVPDHVVVGLKKASVQVSNTDLRNLIDKKILDAGTLEVIDPFGIHYQFSS